LLDQKYKDIRKEIPESNYQTICVDLEQFNESDDDCVSNTYMRSTKKIPNMLNIGNQKVSSLDFFMGDFNYVNNERFKYAGNGKYSQNYIYSTIAPNHYLYLKSGNPQLYYLDKVRVTGVFEDASKAAELQCPDDESEEEKACDILDMKFPLEEGLIPTVIELVVKTLGGFKFQPADDSNNANDDLSTLASYIRQQLAQGRRSELYDQI
jgi:hypothetical protein